MKCPVCGHANLPGVAECEACQASFTQDDIPADFSASEIERCLMSEKVDRLKPRKPLCVRQDEPLLSAVEILRRENVGCLLVVDGLGRLIGILTEGRLLRRIGISMADLDRLLVKDVMRSNPETIKPEHPLAHAIRLIVVGEVRYLPLVDELGKPVGIVSSGDIVEFIATNCPEPAEAVT